MFQQIAPLYRGYLFLWRCMSLTVHPTPGQQSASHAFETLQRVARDWCEYGRITTSAGLKPALQEALPGFVEQDYGYASFREFVDAARDAGYVRIEQRQGGYPRVLPPDEPDDRQIASPKSPNGVQSEASPLAPPREDPFGEDRRLKTDVWLAFVDWQDDHNRLWDRRARRAFMFPVDDARRPAWDSDPDRFAEISPITSAVQTDWMRDWVSTLEEPSAQASLSAALSINAPKGQFRRELTRLGLGGAWREELQRRVVRYVAEWADHERVALGEMTDQRSAAARQRATVEVRAAAPYAAPVGASQAATAGATPRRPSAVGMDSSDARGTQPPARSHPMQHLPAAGAGGDLVRLRRFLHQVIDRMPLTELAALPVRAEYFLPEP
jgi:hypothetical protein